MGHEVVLWGVIIGMAAAFAAGVWMLYKVCRECNEERR